MIKIGFEGLSKHGYFRRDVSLAVSFKARLRRNLQAQDKYDRAGMS